MNIPKANTLAAQLFSRNHNTNIGSRVFAVDRWLVDKFLQAIGEPALRIILWDGHEIAPANTRPAVGMVIHDRTTLWRLLTNPLLHFGDDYSVGRIEIEGGLVAFMETVYRAMGKTPRFRRNSDPDAYRRNQPNLNSLSGSRRNIHHHYDIGNSFLVPWTRSHLTTPRGKT